MPVSGHSTAAEPCKSAWHLAQGVKNAVPKTILQLMNVEGMTRENVASHLQKYRLYLKRMAGYPPAARLPLDTLQQVQQVIHRTFNIPGYNCAYGSACNLNYAIE